ncbi:MAG TPA: major capsid protein [Pedobacter sp.]|uniref:major capsid protein n=1 Tax=Pedobacter sp. TaxID=1411316 RepID=UPI002C0B150F|nr:major capsid protein [Pedobacter sp.]HMI01625.1 major capsid protein [Pedobacter sp.]
MAIGLFQHRKAVTQAAIAKFSDNKAPNLGLSAFFPTVTTRAKALSIEVQRNRQLVAVDVQRCTDPHRNTFSKSTEKIFIPPFYSEMVDFTSCQGYDMSFGLGVEPNAETADMLIESAAAETLALKNMILRAIEKQRASVLQTGTVVLKNGDSINYNRKAESMIVKTGTGLWSAVATADPIGDLNTGVEFLRNEGLSAGSTVNAIMGQTAFGYFMLNEKVLKQAAIFNQIRRVDLGMPQFDKVTGMIFQGRVAAGDYMVNIWTYSDFYENPDGSKTKYVDTNNVVLIPDDFEGKTAFGGVPAVFNPNTENQYIAPVQGEFVVHDVIDQIKKAWNLIVESAPLVIPVSVDRLYTMKVS